MEPNIFKLLKNKSSKKNNHSINDSSIWEQNIGSEPVNLPLAIKNKINASKVEHAILYTDNKIISLNESVKKKRQVDKNKKIKIYKYIHDDTEKLLTKVYNKMNFMKNENKELQKLNSLSLQKTSKCFFQTNRPKTTKSEFGFNDRSNIKVQNLFFGKTFSKKNTNRNINYSEDTNSLDNKLLTSRNIEINNNINNTNENTKEETNSNLNSAKKTRKVLSALDKMKKSNLSTFNDNQSKFAKSLKRKKIIFPLDINQNTGEEKFRNLIYVDVEKLYATNKSKKLNLSRINEIYRVQMNKSLNQYNPDRHLLELNKIQLNNINVRQDMEKVKGKMNKKLYDRGQGLFYKNQYLKLKEGIEKENKRRSLEKKPDPIQIPFNIFFKDDEKHKNVKVFPHGYKIRAFYDYWQNCERIQKSKNNDLLNLGADLLFGHINEKDHELLYNSLDELFNALEINPIMKYIDEIKNEKVNRDKNELNERFKKYFPVFTNTEKIMQQLEKRRITKIKKYNENFNVLEKIYEVKNLIKNHENEKNLEPKRLSII